jgi:hypothetical protein
MVVLGIRGLRELGIGVRKKMQYKCNPSRFFSQEFAD